MILLGILTPLAWGYFLLPDAVRRGWGNLLGYALRLLGLRSAVILENLAIAFPGDSADARATRDRLYREAYRHLGNLSLEILLLFGPMRRYVKKAGKLKGVEHWRAAKARGQGVLFLSSHVGNWEVMAAQGAVTEGIDIMLVTKQLKPAWLHRAIERGRARCGVSATYEPKTLRDVLGHLKGNGTVGFVLDQYAGPPIGVRVPFLGVPVGTHTAVAMLAKRTGAVVLPVVNRREDGGRWAIEIEAPVAWETDDDPGRELALNTARYSRILEGHVRSYPGQWLWTHKRFKGDLSPLREDEWSEGRPRR